MAAILSRPQSIKQQWPSQKAQFGVYHKVPTFHKCHVRMISLKYLLAPVPYLIVQDKQ